MSQEFASTFQNSREASDFQRFQHQIVPRNSSAQLGQTHGNRAMRQGAGVVTDWSGGGVKRESRPGVNGLQAIGDGPFDPGVHGAAARKL